MSDDFQQTADQIAAFQKIWAESLTKMMQATFAMSPNSAPPEVLRQMRSGLFQALAQSWDEFMRSPQFLEGMRQWMESAINFRKMSNEFMARVRNEMQAPSREDIDNIMLSVRHMEQRLLDRLDELSGKIHQANGRPAASETAPPEQPARRRRRSRPATK